MVESQPCSDWREMVSLSQPAHIFMLPELESKSHFVSVYMSWVDSAWLCHNSVKSVMSANSLVDIFKTLKERMTICSKVREMVLFMASLVF